MSDENARTEIMQLLIHATRRGALIWRAEDPYEDAFDSEARGGSFKIRWIYWYNKEGITIDRQCLSVSSDRWRLASAWGTEGMDWAARLASLASTRLGDHFRGLATDAGDFASAGRIDNLEAGPMSESGSLSTIWLDAARLLLRLTSERKLPWKRSPEPLEPDVYTARMGEREFMIEMLRPTVDEGAPSDILVARVSIGGTVMCFAAGTPGMEVVREILALSLPEWAERLATEREALEADCRFLRSLISD